jgi:hypothetical protein
MTLLERHKFITFPTACLDQEKDYEVTISPTQKIKGNRYSFYPNHDLPLLVMNCVSISPRKDDVHRRSKRVSNTINSLSLLKTCPKQIGGEQKAFKFEMFGIKSIDEEGRNPEDVSGISEEVEDFDFNADLYFNKMGPPLN